MRRALFLALAASLVGGWIACRAPTEMLVRVTTNFDCSLLSGNEVSIRFGPAFLPSGPVSSTSRACVNGYAGTLVLTPSGRGDRVDIEVMAALAPATLDADGSCKEGDPGCIHARRSLPFLANTPLTVPITLDQGCAGRSCNLATETCLAGQCVPNAVDPNQCDAGSCALNPPTSPLAAECGDMSGLQAGAPLPTAAGCPGRTVVSTEHGPATAPSTRIPIAVNGVPLDGIVIDKNNVAYVVTTAGMLYAFALDQVVQRWAVTLQPNPIVNVATGTQVIAATGRLYAAGDTEIHVFDTTDGTEPEPPVATMGDIASDLNMGPGGRITFTNTSGQIESMETIPSLATGPTASFPQYVYVGTYFASTLWVGDNIGQLWALDPVTMQIPTTAAFTALNGYLFTSGGPDGLLRVFAGDNTGNVTVAALDPSSHAPVWSQAVSAAGSIGMAVTHDGTAWVLAGGTGRTITPSGAVGPSFPSSVRFAGFDVDGYVYTQDASGALTSYDNTGTPRWTTPFQDPLSEIVVAKNQILVGLGSDTNVYVYKL